MTAALDTSFHGRSRTASAPADAATRPEASARKVVAALGEAALVEVVWTGFEDRRAALLDPAA